MQDNVNIDQHYIINIVQSIKYIDNMLMTRIDEICLLNNYEHLQQCYQYVLSCCTKKPYCLVNSTLDNSGNSYLFIVMPQNEPGRIYEAIEYKNMILIMMHTIDMTNMTSTLYSKDMINMSKLITRHLQSIYQERMLKMLDYKIINYLPLSMKISECYVNGPYEKTIYEMNLPSKNETQQLLWYEYYMKINQLLYNSSKQPKSKQPKSKQTKSKQTITNDMN